MDKRELDREFHALVDAGIGTVDYLAEDFREVSAAVDDYGDAGNVWLVLDKEETISFLEGNRNLKVKKCDATASQSERTLLLSDIKLVDEVIARVRQNQVGNIQMGHYGEISFSRRTVRPTPQVEEMLRYLFGAQPGR
jgi:hypothetical protein